MKYTILLCCALLGFTGGGVAQDILGGEVSFTHIQASVYSIEVNLYTRTSLGIDHGEVVFDSGDGSPEQAIAGSASNLDNDITEWQYAFEHVFPGPGAYYMHVLDSNRIAGILNISDSEQEGIQSVAQLVINPLSGVNSSPQFFHKQTEVQLQGDMLVHDAGATDPDGDELVYSLVPASTSNYEFPPGATIDATTGIFQMPFAAGLHAINIKVEEFRNAQLVGVSYREMTIDGALVSTSDEIKDQFGIRAYPNPVVNELIVNSSGMMNEIQVFDSAGRLVHSSGTVSSNNLSIEFSAFSSGMYFVQISNSRGEVEVLPVVKE